MDKARPVTIDVAIGKAKTTVYLGTPLKKFEDMINNGVPSMLATPGLTPLQGGEPIMCDSNVCGAVGGKWLKRGNGLENCSDPGKGN